MFIEVIPRVHSIGFRPLTYSVGDVFEEGISPGCLVEIPFGKKKETGLVTNILEKPPSFEGPIKPILGVICSHEILASYQVELMQNIAHRSMIPLYKVLTIFLSQAVMKRLIKQNFPILYESESIEKKRNFHIKITKDTIVDSTIVKNHVQPKTVVICSDDFMLYRFEKELSNVYPDAVFLPGEASDTKKARIWIELAQGKHSIIFGTRKVLYYNLRAFDYILYLEDAFCSEYYHYPTKILYHDIFSFLKEKAQFDMTILTSIPKLETLHRFHDSDIQYI